MNSVLVIKPVAILVALSLLPESRVCCASISDLTSDVERPTSPVEVKHAYWSSATLPPSILTAFVFAIPKVRLSCLLLLSWPSWVWILKQTLLSWLNSALETSPLLMQSAPILFEALIVSSLASIWLCIPSHTPFR